MEQRELSSAEINRIKKKLINNYNSIYEEYSRIQSDSKNNGNAVFKNAVSKDYNKKEYETVLSLAREGMPEAIFEICSFHTSDLQRLEIDKKLLPLFGANYVADETESQDKYFDGKIARCGILNYCEFTKKIISKKNSSSQIELEAYKREWTERREMVFCGTQDGLYDENNTLNYILTKIIPIATKDIRESVCYFYNKPDAFVPPEDIEEFNILFSQESPCEDFVGHNVLEKIVPPKGRKSIGLFQDELEAFNKKIVFSEDCNKDDVLENKKVRLNLQELDAVSKEIRRSVSKPSSYTTATAFFVVISNLLEEYEDINTLKRDASRLIYNLNKSKAEWLMNFLPEFCYRQLLIDEVLDKLRHESGIPEPWEMVIKEKFCTNDILTSDEVGWWIGKLARFNILTPYFGNNVEFWSNMMPANAGVLIKRFENCLYKDDYLEFAANVCKSLRPPRSNATRIYILWRDSLIGYLLDMPNTEDNLKCFQNVMDRLETWTDDQKEIIEAFYFKAKREKIHSTDYTEDNLDSFVHQLQIDQYASNFKSFEAFEIAATMYMESGNECSGVVTELMKQAIQTREAFAYYLEHTLGAVMKPIVPDEAYLNRKPFPFNPGEHISGSSGVIIEMGAPVVAQTQGVKINDTVKYKAKVNKTEKKGN